MHKNWCGNSCCDCLHPCELDKEMNCSPDCPCLGPSGEMNSEECKNCDANIYKEEA